MTNANLNAMNRAAVKALTGSGAYFWRSARQHVRDYYDDVHVGTKTRHAKTNLLLNIYGQDIRSVWPKENLTCHNRTQSQETRRAGWQKKCLTH